MMDLVTRKITRKGENQWIVELCHMQSGPLIASDRPCGCEVLSANTIWRPEAAIALS
jgi:hypothetical protein